MSVVDIAVPDIGDFHDIPVIDVLVKPGDTVKKEDSLVTLESDKATMDIPSTVDGTVQEIKVKVGDTVSQGTTVLTIASADVPAVSGVAARETAPTVEPQAAALPPTFAAVPAPNVPVIATNGKSQHPSDEIPADEVHASPSIRRFARELGVPISVVRGSGPNSRITREDVQSYVKRTLRESAPGQAGQHSGMTIAPAPKVDFALFGPTQRVALTRIQRIAGPALHRNWVTIPHVTNNDDADVTALETFRQRLNAEQTAVKVTLLAFIVKACVAALIKYPRFNSSLDGDAIVVKEYYNIGFAADTPDGLVVPVIKHADRKGIYDIASETAELAAKARAGKLGIGDMQGGTFSISSLGGIGGTYFTPIINAPEVAILGACRTAMRPVWDGAAFEAKMMLPLSLSWDHRVVDGAAAARFLSYLIEVLGDMRRTLL